MSHAVGFYVKDDVNISSILDEYKKTEKLFCSEFEKGVLPDIKGYKAYGYNSATFYDGDLISILREDPTDNYEDFKKKEKAEMLKKLEDIKKLLQDSKYKNKLKTFQRKEKKHTKYIEKLFKDIASYEMDMMKRIQSRKDISEQEKSNLLEDLYNEIDKISAEKEKTIEYQQKQNEYINFYKENSVIYESTLYTLKKTQKEKKPYVQLNNDVVKQIMDGGDIEVDEEEVIYIYEDPFPLNIDDAINAWKQDIQQNKRLEEFLVIKEFIEKILKVTDSVIMVSVMLGEKTTEINAQENIEIKDLKIEHFLNLPIPGAIEFFN